MENAKGKGLLKVVGILLIIGGVINAVSGIFVYIGSFAVKSLVDSGAVDSALTSEAASVLTGSALIISCALALIGGVLKIIAGILGIKYANRPEKAMICIVFSIILIILTVISNIINFSMFGIILGVVLPVLYLIGAVLNKKEATE